MKTGLLFASLLMFSQSASGQSVYEGRIDDEFSGWEGETIYKLQDGHIIQQKEYHYHYHYAYSPKVIIYESKYGGLKIHIDGDSDQDVGIAFLK